MPVDKAVEDPLAAGHDLVIADSPGIFPAEDAFFGQEIMVVLQLIRIIQQKELHGGKDQEAEDSYDLMRRNRISQTLAV